MFQRPIPNVTMGMRGPPGAIDGGSILPDGGYRSIPYGGRIIVGTKRCLPIAGVVSSDLTMAM